MHVALTQLVTNICTYHFLAASKIYPTHRFKSALATVPQFRNFRSHIIVNADDNVNFSGIDVSDPERVVKARIQRDFALASVGSSSTAQSPRSSKSSKSTVLRKKILPSKGRLTPEWFVEGLQAARSDSANGTSVASE